jgi:hypothetical protein
VEEISVFSPTGGGVLNNICLKEFRKQKRNVTLADIRTHYLSKLRWSANDYTETSCFKVISYQFLRVAEENQEVIHDKRSPFRDSKLGSPTYKVEVLLNTM